MNKKNRRKITFFILAASILMLASTGVVGLFRAPSLNIDIVDHLKPITARDRLLVFAPHCDDEILGAAGLIMAAVERGAPVKIVVITNGDNNYFSTGIEFKTLYPTPREYIRAGEVRQRESLRALKHLGVAEKDVDFLGFPDGGIRALYTKNRPSARPYRSRGTEDTIAPYRLIYEPGVVYSGENLLRNIEEITKTFSPTIIAGPHLDDHHPDHEYSAKFIISALDALYGQNGGGEKPALLTYLVHYPNFPRPKGPKPDEFLRPPFSATLDFQWYKLMLTAEAENKKREAIKYHSSQIKVPELGKLMKSLVRRNELFEEVDAYGAVPQ